MNYVPGLYGQHIRAAADIDEAALRDDLLLSKLNELIEYFTIERMQDGDVHIWFMGRLTPEYRRFLQNMCEKWSKPRLHSGNARGDEQ